MLLCVGRSQGETTPIAFLRPEAKFASLEEMTAQIDDDTSMARMILTAG
jgi:FAD synthase